MILRRKSTKDAWWYVQQSVQQSNVRAMYLLLLTLIVVKLAYELVISEIDVPAL